MKNGNNKLLFFVFLTSLCGIFFFSNFHSIQASTLITDNIQTNTTWAIDASPYILKNSIDIALGITLTIDPGVVVKFDPIANASINVFGDLVVGNEEDNDKVYFTSNYDNTVGGDTSEGYFCYEDFDEDGNSLGEVCDDSLLIPSKEDWQGINFIDSHSNFIKNAVFKYTSNVAFLDHSYLNIRNLEILDSMSTFFAITSNIDAFNLNCKNIAGSFLYAINSSNFNLSDSSIDTIQGDAIYVYDFSTLNISDSSIKNVSDGSVVNVFDSSTLNISDSSIKNVLGGSAVYIFNDSIFNADKLKIENITGDYNYGINVFNNSRSTLKNSSFKNCPGGACVAFYDQNEYVLKPSFLNIEKSMFDGGIGSAILSYGDSNVSAKISNSIIKNFDYFAIANYSNLFRINAEDNFWGNDTGPFHPDENPTGTAGIVFDNVDFMPFCITDKCKPRDPVILIPGIMGTEIIKDYDDQKEIWPNVNKLIFSITDNFLNDLALNIDGTEKSSMPMKLGDIIRGTHLDILGVEYDNETFEGLIDELIGNGYVENTNLFVFPYDWRKSNTESAEKLKEKINKILADTGADKVDLVAHSMGGLVAKKYIADNGVGNVDQLIFIGTPQLGAPKAFKVIMEGDDMGIGYTLNSLNLKLHFLSPDKSKYISQNMPGVFELLPSKKYIDGQSDFSGKKYITDYITPSISSPKSSVKPDLSYGGTEDFLKSQKINTKMLDFANDLHNDTDNLDLSGVKVFSFIGCGATKTIGHITVKKKNTGILFWKKLINTYDLEYENGDDTVPLRSADDSFGRKYYVKGSSHGGLPSASGIQELATTILRGKKVIDFPNVSLNKNDCFIKGKTLSFYSMLPMMEYLVYDGSGNYTGPVKSIDLKSIQDPTEIADISDEIEYGIPGVQYNKIGANTSIFLPAGGNYKIVVKNIPSSGGGGNGNIINSYDLNIENINADDSVGGSVNFNNIVVDNPDEIFQIEIPDESFPGEIDEEIPPIIQIDDDSDGDFEKEIPPTIILDDIQTNDILAPNTTILVEGNIVSFSAIDDNSGVLNTQYSLDGGINWANYITPFEINLFAGGNDIEIQYFSTDNAGNIEPIQIMIIPSPPIPKIIPTPIPISTPVIPIVSNNPLRRISGGMVLLSEGIRTDIKEAVSLSLGNLNDFPFKRTTLKEVKEPSLSNLDVILKRSVHKEAQEPPMVSIESKGTLGQSLIKKSQTASSLNSNFNFKFIWIFVVFVLLGIGIFVARKNRNE